MYVVRLKGEVRGDSAPCIDCYRKLKELKIRIIVYSTENGFVKQKLKDFVPKLVTSGNRSCRHLC